MYIPRHAEKSLRKIADMYGAVMVTGARQVGKTTMLRKSFGEEARYVTFDRPDIVEYAKSEGTLFFKTYEPPVILDEVQYAPGIFPFIKIIIDETGKARLFFMTGSQSFPLMKQVTESLAGRVGIIELLGLSLREILEKEIYTPFLPTSGYIEEAKQTEKPVDAKRIWQIIHTGAMPRLYQQETSQDFWEQYWGDYLRTYIERDVRALTQIGDERAFLQFMRLVAASTGQMVNMSAIASSIGKAVATVQNWLSVLVTSGLVFLLQPYSHNFNKRIVKTPKLYFLDTGLASYLTGWYTAEQLERGAVSGAMFETFVISEILKGYRNAGKGTDFFSYYRDKEKREIDLIIERNDVLYPVEIKKTASPSKKDIANFSILEHEKIKQLGEGALICMSDDVVYLTEKNRAMPIALL